MYVCVYIHVYIHMCVHAYVCMYVHTYVCIRMYVIMYMRAIECMLKEMGHGRTCVCLYACTRVCQVCARECVAEMERADGLLLALQQHATHTHTHTHTHNTHTHTHTHTHCSGNRAGRWVAVGLAATCRCAFSPGDTA